jgi:hypothetical protein
MISGALEIIYGVDAGLVHPLLLPASQGPDKFGYIVITYDDSPEVFDILFVRGDHVEEYAGLHHDLRTLLSEQSVKTGLAACGMRCRVYLFSVSRQGFDRFRRTFHSVPSVNVVIDRLTRKQLSSLLIGTGSKNGILEIDRPSDPFPLIVLSRFHSAEELVNEAFRFKQGRMIVYDLELNALIRQRGESVTGGTGACGGDAPATDAVEMTPADTDRAGGEQGEESARDTLLKGVPPEESCESELVELFRDALDDFRKAVVEIYGGKVAGKMHHILYDLPPSFAIVVPRIFIPSFASAILDVFEECVHHARIIRRKRVRARAMEIIKNLYDTNHELLRKHGVESRVQICYQRLGE